MKKRLFILAGPNGAGKTTHAATLQPELININHYLPLADTAHIFDNSSAKSSILIATKNKNKTCIKNEVIWQKIEKDANG